MDHISGPSLPLSEEQVDILEDKVLWFLTDLKDTLDLVAPHGVLEDMAGDVVNRLSRYGVRAPGEED